MCYTTCAGLVGPAQDWHPSLQLGYESRVRPTGRSICTQLHLSFTLVA
jgi:hypothetical protein